ncbi:unnamed protein product [Schistosoma mattheei]|uniref:Derlin n=1 Tax=Schistosoma mattheei TaxID=31246 RepID=A0AA85AUE3_9TREM|nr:unnamed protein product [Schistosoma mattheei]
MLLNSRSLFGLTPVNGYEVQFMGFLIKVSSIIINYPMIVRIFVHVHKIFLTDQQIVSFLASFYVLLEPMVLTVLYIWSQLNRDVIVQFWFGMQFKAMYFPWVLVIFNLIVRGSAMMELVGIIVGHLYYFFVFQYPQEYGGQAILKTPGFL